MNEATETIPHASEKKNTTSPFVSGGPSAVIILVFSNTAPAFSQRSVSFFIV